MTTTASPFADVTALLGVPPGTRPLPLEPTLPFPLVRRVDRRAAPTTRDRASSRSTR